MNAVSIGMADIEIICLLMGYAYSQEEL